MRNILAYVLILTTCGAAIWLTLVTGRSLQRHDAIAHVSRTVPESGGIAKTLNDNSRGPLAILLTQIVLIVLVCRALGKAAAMIGQPQVIGEMIAGILLGPSFLGQISPAAMESLFPAASMDTLRMFSCSSSERMWTYNIFSRRRARPYW